MDNNDAWPVGRELVDLSQPIENGMFHSPRYPAPTITKLSSIDTDGMSITHASFHAHTGTHVDAPSHFVPGGESITEVSLDRFVGDGIVVSVHRQAGEEIPAFDVAPQVEAFGPDAMVCLHSGWDSRYGTATEYEQFPFLSLDLAHALVGLRVRMLALDTPSPDMPDGSRPEYFDWPVHRILMEGGVLITEQLTGLDLIRGRRFRLYALPIALAGSDGAPARVVAELH
ncbi:cyclase family protein [Pedococcus sp. 5OH_020]|uniref:cyclase family protein n=1 Tax=Pedococcus sp. 5OH_020 TaxID=2989814 RepID=UPI0022E9B627|nr:cyclase family protein [Pedococcus sp. 5OH_020]